MNGFRHIGLAGKPVHSHNVEVVVEHGPAPIVLEDMDIARPGVDIGHGHAFAGTLATAADGAKKVSLWIKTGDLALYHVGDEYAIPLVYSHPRHVAVKKVRVRGLSQEQLEVSLRG